MDSLRMPASTGSLEQIRSYVLGKIEHLQLSPQKLFKVELALEEVLTNIIHYAYPQGEGYMEVGCFLEDKRKLHLSVRDWGRPFNPLTFQAPNDVQDLTERKIGGLGIHLVKKMAEKVDYKRQAGSNILILCFDLSSS